MLQQKLGRADHCMSLRQAPVRCRIDMPHRPLSQKSTGHTPEGQTLGSLCCEQLRRTPPTRPPCDTGPLPVEMIVSHPCRAQRCRCSSLDIGKITLFIPTLRVSRKPPHCSRTCMGQPQQTSRLVEPYKNYPGWCTHWV
jgi:hypothetical protein